MADRDEESIPRGLPVDEADNDEEIQDFRFLASLS